MVIVFYIGFQVIGDEMGLYVVDNFGQFGIDFVMYGEFNGEFGCICIYFFQGLVDQQIVGLFDQV